HQREVFVSHPGRCMIVRLSADQRGKVSFTASLSSLLRHRTMADGGVWRMFGQAPMQGFGYTGREQPPVYDDENPEPRGTRWETQLAAVAEGGELRLTDDGLVAE